MHRDCSPTPLLCKPLLGSGTAGLQVSCITTSPQFLHQEPLADPVAGVTPKGGRVPAQSTSPPAPVMTLQMGHSFCCTWGPRSGWHQPTQGLAEISLPPSQPSGANSSSSRQSKKEGEHGGDRSPGRYGASLGSTSAQVCSIPRERPEKGRCSALSQGGQDAQHWGWDPARADVRPAHPSPRHNSAAPHRTPACHN